MQINPADTCYVKGEIMKKLLSVILACVLLTGCGYPAPKDWYKETLEYYAAGFNSDWKNERPDLFVCDEMKDKQYKFGYLLTDLDNDGTVELLIGFNEDGVTKFTDLYIWHSDKGSFRIVGSGGGYYMYLCDDNIIREDYWYGSNTKTNYYKYISKDNALLNVDSGSNPHECELTYFSEASN